MKKILVIAAFAFILFSCSKEDERPSDAVQMVTEEGPVFYASTEGTPLPVSGTKVYADEELKVLWNADDRVSIFNNSTFNNQYYFAGEDGDNAGRFKRVPESATGTGNSLDHIYSVYPYSPTTIVSDNDETITLTLPAEQTYKEHSFGIGANTMVAISDNNLLVFKNICGYLSVKLYGNDVSISNVYIEGNNGEKIAGKAYVTPEIGENPIVEMDNSATGKIAITSPEPLKLGSSSSDYTEFIFAIPPTTFSDGFKVTVADSLGGIFEKVTTNNLTISRNRMESMEPLEVVLDYSHLLVEFEDANFKAYCVENFDTDGDGEINYGEALAVKKIIVSRNISSMKGLEHFKNLTYLDCSFNQLTQLDISQNTELDTLQCSYNGFQQLNVSNSKKLTFLGCAMCAITQLDVSGCTALLNLGCEVNNIKQLDLSDCLLLQDLCVDVNELTQLDVSIFSSLTSLSCGNNSLTQLDVSNNTNLTRLNCSTNRLSQLNVSNNASLTLLDCSNNQLTQLDVSNNANLSKLYCSDNFLTQLDVSNNTNLTQLYCSRNSLSQLNVSNNTALTQLYCHNNQLSQLDVSNNTNLTSLGCSNNQLIQLEVSSNVLLTSLSCDSNQLIYLDLSTNTQLADLTAWPQSGTLYRLWKKRGQNITYKKSDGTTIVPSNYGTEIVEVD